MCRLSRIFFLRAQNIHNRKLMYLSEEKAMIGIQTNYVYLQKCTIQYLNCVANKIKFIISELIM